jgi:hypothetical protein
VARRQISDAGAWHLGVYECDWTAWTSGRVVGDSTRAARALRAARELDDQKPVGVVLAGRGTRTRFLFDLGCVPETRPYDRTGEQWLRYVRDHRVLVFRADRRYTCRRSSRFGARNRGKDA